MSISSRASKLLASINEKTEEEPHEVAETETVSSNNSSSRMSSPNVESDRRQVPSTPSTAHKSDPIVHTLDTIETSQSPNVIQAESDRRNRAEAGETSPRSIEHVDGGLMHTAQESSVSEGSSGARRSTSRRSRRHRRVGSEDVPRVVQGAPSTPPHLNHYPNHAPYGLYGEPHPHPAGGSPRNAYSYHGMAPPGTPPSYGAQYPGYGQTPPQDLPPNAYEWHKAEYSAYQGYQRGYVPEYGAHPVDPNRGRANSYSHEANMLLPHRPKAPPPMTPHRGHRKSLSSSAAMPGYGSFWKSQEATNNSAGSAPGNFSPRGEIMGLTSTLRGLGSSASSSPRASPVPTRPNVTWSPNYTPLTPPMIPAPIDGLGGEAVFSAHRKLRPESARKRHMRQESAQLFVEDIKGVEQTPACRNIFFLLAFVFHLFFIVYLNNTFAWAALKDANDPTAGLYDTNGGSQVVIYYQNMMYMCLWCGVFSVVLSATLLIVVTMFAAVFLQVALVSVITLSFVWGTVGIGLSPKSVVPITGVIALALGVAYAFIVWDRIPFAAANLSTALSGVRAFPGTIFVAFCVQALALVYCIYFVVTATGVYDAIDDGRITASQQGITCIYVFFAMSFYWTYNVLLNIVQVATAKIIGNWWLQKPDAAGARESTVRTIFYSMGSICFGSLVVGPVMLIRQIAILFRPSEEASLLCFHQCLYCIQNCIASCIHYITDNINGWAMTYIGLYGYGFIDGGRHATDLFEKRGWTTIVSDDLIHNVLVMTSLGIGGATGCFGYFLSGLDSIHVSSLEAPELASFAIGLGVGVALTTVLFGIISSSVNAVIVCFASNPVDFERNHPALSHKMRSAWREVWPGALDMVDARIAFSTGAMPMV